MLFAQIVAHSCFGIAEASADEIDTLNIHHATMLAMKRAFAIMRDGFSAVTPVAALVDGKFAPPLSCETRPVIRGDSKSLSIAAASILAKVTRDRIMTKLHGEYPHYGWNSNAGYPTAAHIAGLHEQGITPHHRRSYAPVRDAARRAQAQ
jgi:ribonuclease HII